MKRASQSEARVCRSLHTPDAAVAESGAPTRLGTARESIRSYAAPILLLVLSLPIVAYSAYSSIELFDRPFPGFIMIDNGIVATVGSMDYPADKAGVFLTEVTALDGIPVNSSAEVHARVVAEPPGTSFEYTLRRGDEVYRREITSAMWTVWDYLQVYGVFFFFGWGSLAVGTIVGFLQPRSVQGRAYMLQAFVAGIYAVTAVFLHRPGFPWMTNLCILMESVFPATFITLALVFPVEQRIDRRRQWALAAAYTFSLLLFGLKLQGLAAEPPDLNAALVNYIYIAASILLFVAMMARNYRLTEDAQARLKIKAVLPGLIMGTGLMFIVFIDIVAEGGNLPIQTGLPAVVIFYASIGYAVARHDLFDVDEQVRRTVVYATLTVVVAGAYAVLLEASQWLLPSFAANRVGPTSAFILALALCFDPLRRGIQTLVDRAFYRSRLDYRATISRVSEVLTSLLDLREVARQVTRVVTDSMHLQSATLCVLPAAGASGSMWKRSATGVEDESEPDGVTRALVRLSGENPTIFNAARLITRCDDPAEEERLAAAVAQQQVAMILPLLTGEGSLGAVLFGPKRSGAPFGSDDVALLQTLAHQAAVSVQNAQSYRQLEQLTAELDEKVTQRTEQLRVSNADLQQAYDDLKSAQDQLVQKEKLASLGQLVAGVAHELNNPASFVHGGIENLTEYLGRIIEVVRAYEGVGVADPEAASEISQLRSKKRLDYVMKETPELLRICAEGSERIKRIVDDLRVFARADSGERQEVDVTQSIDSTIHLLQDRVAARGVSIERHYDSHPTIGADPSQLGQVWMNLLSNALEAMEESTESRLEIEVREVSVPSDGVEVVIRDTGTGIDSARLGKIFDPFFTTKPIGRGTGLGLSIVYGAVQAHRGMIRAVPNEGAEPGTAMVVYLPRAAERPTGSA